MYNNYVFETASEALPRLLKKAFEKGSLVPSRAGATMELTHLGITLTKPHRREILCPHRKPSIAAQVAETMWVLAGRDDIEWLGHYLPRAKDFSDDGLTWRAGYGKRLRSWPSTNVPGFPHDQLAYVVNTLKANPESRQAVMSIWDPAIDSAPGKDIACNNWLSFISRNNRLDLMVAIRSNDAIWGWSGINAFEWSALLEVVAGLTRLQVGSLHFAVTSWHVYEQHWDKAKKISETKGSSESGFLDSPRFDWTICKTLPEFDALCAEWFKLEERIRTGQRVSIAAFPEPMMRSWLQVIAWWWGSDTENLVGLERTRLEQACKVSVAPPKPSEILAAVPNYSTEEGRKFVTYVTGLHNEKHKAYGDSWKRRGEMLGIMANIARKIDRLGGGETWDETQADTAMDLLVYLAKYRSWLGEFLENEPVGSTDDPEPANIIIRNTEAQRRWSARGTHDLVGWLTAAFEDLETYVTEKDDRRVAHVDAMISEAFRLAWLRWGSFPDPEFVGGDHDLP